jgi:folate-binding Fe-S cluster repair protein YgfZ
LHFTKGCYIGQEIVERIRSRGNVHRVFAGFRVHGAAPLPGTKIYVGDKEVGEITSAASIPAMLTSKDSDNTLAPLPRANSDANSAMFAAKDSDNTLALGYIRREAATPGTEVKIGPDMARVESLPFSI